MIYDACPKVHLEVPPQEVLNTCQFLLKRNISSGFLCVYCKGVGDYPGAFTLLFENMMLLESKYGLNATGTSTGTNTGTGDDREYRDSSSNANTNQNKLAPKLAMAIPIPLTLSPEQIKVVYKLLLYVRYAARDMAFPTGTVLKTSTSQLTSLLQLVLSENREMLTDSQLDRFPWLDDRDTTGDSNSGNGSNGNGNSNSDSNSNGTSPRLALPYPYMRVLAEVDAGALMLCVANALECLQKKEKHDVSPAVVAAMYAHVRITVLRI
jgi:hypothetical protein